MSVHWCIKRETQIVEVVFGAEIVAADIERFNREVLLTGEAHGLDFLIDLSTAECGQIVFMDLAAPIEAFIKALLLHGQRKVAIYADLEDQQQLARFFSAIKDLVPESQGIEIYLANDQYHAGLWLGHVK